MSFVLCLILDYWKIKHVLLLIFLSIVHHANLAKVKFYLFLIPHLVPHNVLILYIVMFGGIAPIVSYAHYKYFVTFIDDFSCFTWVYFLWAKAEVFSVFKQFLALIETQFSTSIKVLCSDFGREYMSNEFQDFLQSKWIISQCSCSSTPQQNSVVEWKNCHLLDELRTLLLDSSVSPRFWCKTLSTAVHLINRLPSPMLNHVSPFSKLFGHSSLYYDLRTFGCVCFVHLPTHEWHKLTAQSIKCDFLGYAIPHKGYV